MTATSIEWVRGSDGSKGMSWNSLRAWIRITRKGHTFEVSANHCERVNEACRFCYAERQNYRLGGVSFKPGNRHLYRFAVDPMKLMEPVHRRKPTRIFVESMSDTFGTWWPTEYIDQLYAVMSMCPQHTFINLTKRPDRRRDYLVDPDMPGRVAKASGDIRESMGTARLEFSTKDAMMCGPLRNVIEGTSVSCQEDADEFVPILLATRCHRRAVSAEPLLGPIDFLRYLDIKSQDPLVVAEPTLHWIITGGESGDKARPAHPSWFRGISAQCDLAGIAYHHKQNGEWLHESQDQHYDSLNPPSGRVHRWDDGGSASYMVGKKFAGRLLDGKEHNGFPAL
mgnify:CR=1 FL=1